ncbi:MAG: PAS domain-containing sensor histidine kinase [Minwuia sp.]|nr:PAS domain-containing sensor histidine kinase [Minwuia sp.]
MGDVLSIKSAQTGSDVIDQVLVDAFARLDAPVVVTRDAPGVSSPIIASSKAFDALVADGVEPLDTIGPLSDLSSRPLRGVEGWTVAGKALRDNATLWQCTRDEIRTEQVIIDLLSEASAENIALMYFGPDRRIKAWTPGMHAFFPDKDLFPVPNGTIEDQIDNILKHDLIPGAAGYEHVLRENLLRGFDNPEKPLVDRTASGLWSISVTCMLPNGGRLHVMGDVSDFKHREEQLKTYMSNVDGILFCRRRQGSEHVQVWGRLARFMGPDQSSTSHRIRPEDWFHTFDEGCRQPYIDMMEEHRRTLEPYLIEFGWTNPVTREHHWAREEGWTTRDRFGEVYHDSVIVDVTEQKIAMLRHEDSEARFRGFAELASDWYFEIDADMRFTYISDRCELLFGLSGEFVIGREWAEIVGMGRPAQLPAARIAWLGVMDDLVARRPVQRVQVPLLIGKIRKDVEISAAPMIDSDGTFVGYRGVGRDITEMVEAREQAVEALRHAEDANRAKSAFVANMSHELRTPLNAIIGFSTVMKSELLGPMQNAKYLGYVGDIAASGEHLLSLVNDVLDISRVEANRMDIDPEQIDLKAELRSLADLFRQDLQERDFELVVAADLQPPLHADRRALRQMVMNLLSNAIKFSGRGNRVVLQAARDDAGDYMITVQDSGRGIQADEIEKVMEPFGRGGDLDVTPGTGLGLPLTRQLAELHGGRLALTSTYGEGTIVTIFLPAEPVLEIDDNPVD